MLFTYGLLKYADTRTVHVRGKYGYTHILYTFFVGIKLCGQVTGYGLSPVYNIYPGYDTIKTVIWGV